MDAPRFAAARTYPVTADAAYDALIAVPLPELFARRYGPMPPIRDVVEEPERFDTVGQHRRILLAGGGSMLETITNADRGELFAYRITELTGPLKPLVHHADGAWAFDPAGTGVRVTWSWTLPPRGAVGAPLVRGLRPFWNGYARRALETFEHLLVP